MECIALIVLMCAAALDAYPYPVPYPYPYPFLDLQSGLGGGLGAGIGGGLGTGIGGGLGTGIGEGLGTDIGVGVGDVIRNGVGFGLHGAETIGRGAVGLGVGLANGLANGLNGGLGAGIRPGVGAGIHSGGGYVNRDDYAGQNYNGGAGGYLNQGEHASGANEFHDVGSHHSSLTSITQSEQSENHNVGGSQAFEHGAQTNAGFNKHQNGASQAGSHLNAGAQHASLGVGVGV